MKNYCLSKYVTISRINDEYVLFNWKTNESVTIYDKTCYLYKVLADGNSLFDSSFANEDFEYLILNEYLTEDGFKEDYGEESQDENSLHLILLPADEACNFKCKYCYESSQGRYFMANENAEAIVNLVNNKKPSSLWIEYFGGEPLLNYNFIIDLNKRLKNCAELSGFKFGSSITTNGYLLTKEKFSELLECGVIRFQITIDGIEADHNILRPLASGKETYSVILKNLKEIHSIINKDFRIVVRTNFNETSATTEKRHRYLADLKNTFGGDFRFKLRFKPIGNYSELNKIENKYNLECGKMAANNLKSVYENEAAANGFSLADLEAQSNIGGSRCYAGKNNSFIIKPDNKRKDMKKKLR